MQEKNTIYNIQAIDLTAFIESIENLRNNYLMIDEYELRYKDTNKQKIKAIEVLITRQAMNQTGYRVGTEYCKITFKVYQKKEFNVNRLPVGFSEEIIFPDCYTFKTNCPKKQYSEDKDEFGERECLYFPPDDEFWYQEIDCIMNDIIENLPIAEFNSKERQWNIGSSYWNLDK